MHNGDQDIKGNIFFFDLVVNFSKRNGTPENFSDNSGIFFLYLPIKIYIVGTHKKYFILWELVKRASVRHF